MTNSRLQFNECSGYAFPAPYKTGAGFDISDIQADSRDLFSMRFFYVRTSRYVQIMVGRSEGAFGLAGFLCAGMSTLLRLTTPFDIGLVRSKKLTQEAVIMTAIPILSVPRLRAYPEIQLVDGHAVTTSMAVAEYFLKAHDDVLRKIRNTMADCPKEWCLRNFTEASRDVIQPNSGVATYKYYQLTRDAFVLITMGFTGKRALQWKIDYINAFNAMEAKLHGEASGANCRLLLRLINNEVSSVQTLSERAVVFEPNEIDDEIIYRHLPAESLHRIADACTKQLAQLAGEEKK